MPQRSNPKRKKPKPNPGLLRYERKLKTKGRGLIIGVDEAGRGPLAGPVVAAAAILGSRRFDNLIDDSKKLTPIQRERAFFEIVKKSIFGIGIANEKIIDKYNILQSTRIAMEQAVRQLIDKLDEGQRSKVQILVDGDVKLFADYPVTNVIKGDSRCLSIAAASILAKVTRDRIMSGYDRMYPQYGFIRHKGYPTRSHRQALREFGASLIHRMSFYGV